MRFASGSLDKTILIWNQLFINDLNLTYHAGGINGLAISNDYHLLSASKDTTVKSWSISNNSIDLINILNGNDKTFQDAIQLGNYLITCSNDFTVKVWNQSNFNSCISLEGHQDHVYSVVSL